MARNSIYSEVKRWRPGRVLFKPNHIKSKGQLIVRYKKSKKYKKNPKKLKIDDQQSPLLKSARENVNKCLQNNGNLLFSCGFNIVKVNLKSMKTKQKSSSLDLVYPGGVVMCAIPDQKFFCIDCGKGLMFIFDIELNILVRKRIKERFWGTIIYFNGLIYGFRMLGLYRIIQTYNLNTSSYGKAAMIELEGLNCDISCAVFEEKIAIVPVSKWYLAIYDPFCNSYSNVLKLCQDAYAVLLVANDKLYCIQSQRYVYESIPRDFTQWICIGVNKFCWWIYGLPSYSLYNDEIYFVGAPKRPSLYKFNLKSLRIELIDHLF